MEQTTQPTEGPELYGLQFIRHTGMLVLWHQSNHLDYFRQLVCAHPEFSPRKSTQENRGQSVGQFERAPGADPADGFLPWWRELASAENLYKLHDALKAVVLYPHEALCKLEQMMRRRPGG